MKKIVIILLVLITTFPNYKLYAQTDLFTILAVQGKVAISKNKPDVWKNLKIGDKFSSEYKIKIGKNSYAGMIYANGKSVELHQQGIFNCSELKSSALGSPASSNKKFVEFVLKELTKNIENSREMKVTGAVVRERINEIVVGIPSNTSIIDANMNFKWFPYTGTNDYNFKIIDEENKTIYMKKLQDTSITIDLNLFCFPGNPGFRWIVSDYDNSKISSDTNYIIKFTQSQAEAIKDSVALINETIGNEESSINQTILAEFYQRNNLNIDALEAYKKAVKLSPGVKIYPNLFKEFLNKVGLIRI
jgi:hypothetical protein